MYVSNVVELEVKVKNKYFLFEVTGLCYASHVSVSAKLMLKKSNAK
jgi:hypothetical protein